MNNVKLCVHYNIQKWHYTKSIRRSSGRFNTIWGQNPAVLFLSDTCEVTF